jgi:hypothetical protein
MGFLWHKTIINLKSDKMKTKLFIFKSVNGQLFKVRCENELSAFEFAVNSYGWVKLIGVKEPRKTFRKQILFY